MVSAGRSSRCSSHRARTLTTRRCWLKKMRGQPEKTGVKRNSEGRASSRASNGNRSKGRAEYTGAVSRSSTTNGCSC
jgi:hypothetical protein